MSVSHFHSKLNRERGKSEELIDLLGLREIKIVTGVRRSGKTTLLYQVIDHLLKSGVSPENILLINFEDAALAHYAPDEIYESYLSLLNPTFGNFVFIDEAQRKPGWEHWIRKMYDLKHAVNFFVSGSSADLLKKEYSTLLTGRNISMDVFPMSFREFLDFSDVRVKSVEIVGTETRSRVLFSLKKYLEWGGFPEVFFVDQYFRNCRVPNTIPSHATIQPQSPRERPPKPSRIHSHSAKTDHPSAK